MILQKWSFVTTPNAPLPIKLPIDCHSKFSEKFNFSSWQNFEFGFHLNLDYEITFRSGKISVNYTQSNRVWKLFLHVYRNYCWISKEIGLNMKLIQSHWYFNSFEIQHQSYEIHINYLDIIFESLNSMTECLTSRK